MQRRILVFFGVAGALAGIVVLIILLMRERPRVSYVATVAPPVQTAPPLEDELKAITQRGTVKGKVIHGLTKEPVPRAAVLALQPYLDRSEDDDVPLWGQLREKARVYTDAKGEFAIEDLPTDYWNLWIEKKGYGFTTVPRAKFDVDHVIEIFPGCSVRGRVVYEDDTPAAGVKVEYTPQGTHSEVFGRWQLQAYWSATDADGYFEYTEIPPGKFTIEVYPEEHLPAPWKFEQPLKSGENRDLGTRKLTRGFGMKVYVKWRGTEEPVPGVEVVVVPIGDPMPRTKTGRRRRTNEKGLAQFSGLGGQVLEKPRFQVVANVDGVGPVMPDERRMWKPDDTVTIYLRKDSTIVGKVERPNGKPLEHFSVSLEPKGFLTTQKRAWGENGAFTLYSVPEGDYTLHVRYGNLVDQEKEIRAIAGQEVDVGTITMAEGAEIAGTVTNSDGSELKGLVKVHLAEKVFDEGLKREFWRTVARAYCKKDGTFQLKGLPPGKFWIWPENTENPSATTDEQFVEIAPGTNIIPFDLKIYSEVRLRLRFMDEVDGVVREVVRVKTTLKELDGKEGKEIAWLGEGTRLRPGRYEVTFEMPNADGVLQRYTWKVIDLQAEGNADPIEVRLYEIR